MQYRPVNEKHKSTFDFLIAYRIILLLKPKTLIFRNLSFHGGT